MPDDISETDPDDSDNSDDDDDDDQNKERNKIKKMRLRKFRKKLPPNLALERDAILPVLPYLKREQLLQCMLVCKRWNGT